MKLRIAIAVVACVVLAGVAWVFTLSAPSATQTVRFAGFTNSVVGLAPVFSTLHTNYAATIQRWLDAGTNVAEFTITNQQSCAIWLYPVGRICTTAASSNLWDAICRLDPGGKKGFALAAQTRWISKP